MSFFGTLKAALFGPTSSVGDPGGWFVRMLGGGRTNTGIAVDEYNALALTPVYAAIRIIAGSVAQLPLMIYRKTSNGAVPVTDHPFSWALTNRPNPLMSSFTLRNTLQHHVLGWGNGYAEIERNGRGQALKLWPLLPDRTRPALVGKSVVIRATLDGQSVDLDPEDVLHVKAIGFDGYVGLSPIRQAREAIAMGLAMEKFGGKFFANDAKSGGFLMHPGKLGPQAFANINGVAGKDEQNPAARLERQGGPDNAFRVKVLEEGMKYVATTIAPEDAQFLASRSFQVEEVSRLYGVPLVLLSSHERTTSWGSGVEQLLIAFITFTIGEWLRQWEEEMNYKIFTQDERDAGLFVRHDTNALMRGDMTARATYIQSGIMNGWLLKNEARVMEGMNKIPGLDDKPATPPPALTPAPVHEEGLRE